MIPGKVQLVAAACAAIALSAALVWGLYWRGEYRELKVANTVLTGQVAVLAEGVKACNAGVDQAKRAGDAAVAASSELVAAARKLKAPAQRTVERIETIIQQPAPAGAGCDSAWDTIEADRKAGGP